MKAEIGSDIQRAVDLLVNDMPVAIPTETVYGLAANAFSEKAVVKIFEAKQRPFFDPLIIHISQNDSISNYCLDIPDKAVALASHFWPGPLTLILTKKNNIPDIVTAGLGTVGIRMPSHPVCQQLLAGLPFPLAAPSANPFGYISPTNAQHVYNQLANAITYILDGGPSEIGLESTIIGFENEKPLIYRLGGISVEEIEELIGKVTLQINESSNPTAPGQLKSHYAPSKPLLVGDIDALLKKYPSKKIGVISFFKVYKGNNISHSWILSSSAHINEAAANIFKVLREADQSNAEILLAEVLPDMGIGMAINDRLKRAATQAR